MVNGRDMHGVLLLDADVTLPGELTFFTLISRGIRVKGIRVPVRERGVKREAERRRGG